MTIIRPRLIDYHNILVTQEEVDFAIPFLDEDIPLYLDPFLLWKSPSQQDNALHLILINTFNKLGKIYLQSEDKKEKLVDVLVELSECSEVGLGSGKTKKGLKISTKTSNEILELFSIIPEYKTTGVSHFEEIQLYVNNISKDRISDFSCNFLKSFLIDFTQDECKKYNIPMKIFKDVRVFNSNTCKIEDEELLLPFNPEGSIPIIFVPKRWLRYTPWINYEDYFQKAYIKEGQEEKIDKPKVLDYNRYNYGMISAYISAKERNQEDCKNDPLFKQIPVISAKKCLNQILKLPSGKTDNADKKYEDNCTKLFSSLLYPHLDFAQAQSRVDSGTQIRDLIFYNNCSFPLLKNLYDEYNCRQIVFEMKNVKEVRRDHINQLNRYLSEQFGRFGIIITRNPFKKNIMRNTIDLWSGQRKCILCITDEDMKLMVDVYEHKQRDPIEVINKKYVEFIRSCPA